MRVAVIGGNLLGCATVANLALVSELDAAAGRESDYDVTLFASESSLGAPDFRSVEVDGLRVETGRCLTLPLPPNTFLSDLVALARGTAGHFTILGRHLKIPGDNRVARGNPRSCSVAHPWGSGTGNQVVRSSALLDGEADRYVSRHAGFRALDVLHKVLRHPIWRALAWAALAWAAGRVRGAEGPLARGRALAAAVFIFGLALLSPAGVAALVQRFCAFWSGALALVLAHGLPAAIWRGSMEGFFKGLKEANARNRATVAPSIGTLLGRTGLAELAASSISNYITRFQYEPPFVTALLAPGVADAYPSQPREGVNALAMFFALTGEDTSNSDIVARREALSPDNAALCPALVEAARVTTPVDVRLETKVASIKLAAGDGTRYIVSPVGGRPEEFDAVILCESPDPSSFAVHTAHGGDVAAVLKYADPTPAAYGPATHLVVVRGVARASFFQFASEADVPDRVQASGARFAVFERLRAPARDADGVYRVICGDGLESSGLLAEMFEAGAEVVFCERRAETPYQIGPLGGPGKDVDDEAPPVVLGTRFLYAAAGRRVAVHPEMDAMCARNAASLLARLVNWEAPDADDADADVEEESKEMHGGAKESSSAAAGVPEN